MHNTSSSWFADVNICNIVTERAVISEHLNKQGVLDIRGQSAERLFSLCFWPQKTPNSTTSAGRLNICRTCTFNAKEKQSFSDSFAADPNLIFLFIYNARPGTCTVLGNSFDAKLNSTNTRLRTQSNICFYHFLPQTLYGVEID